MYGQDGNMGGGFRPRGNFGNRFAPVRVGEEIDVKIEAVGEKGDGIARKKGFILFVPNAQEGDEVRIKITKVLRKVGFAEVVGPAQGEIESNEPQKERRDSEENYGQEVQPEAPEEAPSDSDDFGEESEDVPAEEPEQEITDSEEATEETPTEEEPEQEKVASEDPTEETPTEDEEEKKE